MVFPLLLAYLLMLLCRLLLRHDRSEASVLAKPTGFIAYTAFSCFSGTTPGQFFICIRCGVRFASAMAPLLR